MSLLHIAGGATEDKLDASDVFSTYLYTGNGSTQTINNGIDLAGKGGLVWIKSRTQASGHVLTDTIRGATRYVLSSGTDLEYTNINSITSFNSNGFTLGLMGGINSLDAQHVSWTFRKAPKFFDQQTKVHTNGTASTIDLSVLGEVGMVTVKATSTTSNWYVWHRGLTAGSNLKLNLTDAQSTTNAYLSVSGTTLTIASTAPSATYVIYGYAHDPSADGIIQCGSFTTDASGNATVNLGWEPQYLMFRASSVIDNWYVTDSIRGMAQPTNSSPYLCPNLSNAEDYGSRPKATATGFDFTFAGNTKYIYMAIRRPNKVPTSGSEVYKAIARTGTGAAATVTGVGFAPDLVLFRGRPSGGYCSVFVDKLRGVVPHILLNTADVEGTSKILSSFNMDGISVDDFTGYINGSGVAYINHFFKRSKGFFDIVCYTGTGVTDNKYHNLGVAPEMIILKDRTNTDNWYVYHKDIGASNYLVLNTTAITASWSALWNNTVPTETYISLGGTGRNVVAHTYVMYLFATLAGVSKVGSYTGNGTSQTINCGFSTGARFVLSKAVSTTGNWNIGDSTRGITSGTDPLLCLNTTAAEVTTDDWLDPSAEGFIVNETASAHANTNGVTYIYLAIA